MRCNGKEDDGFWEYLFCGFLSFVQNKWLLFGFFFSFLSKRWSWFNSIFGHILSLFYTIFSSCKVQLLLIGMISVLLYGYCVQIQTSQRHFLFSASNFGTIYERLLIVGLVAGDLGGLEFADSALDESCALLSFHSTLSFFDPYALSEIASWLKSKTFSRLKPKHSCTARWPTKLPEERVVVEEKASRLKHEMVI